MTSGKVLLKVANEFVKDPVRKPSINFLLSIITCYLPMIKRAVGHWASGGKNLKGI
jgi:hypothetical protein